MSITPFLRDGAFDPNDIKAMSMALDDVCQALNLVNGNSGREAIAERIIAIAWNGERSPTLLRDRVLREAGLANAGVMGTARPMGAIGGLRDW
jgi:hypothetical protein